MIHTQTSSPNRIALCVGKKGVCPAHVGVLAPLFEKSANKTKISKIQKYNTNSDIQL